jgi:hypothetical protein
LRGLPRKTGELYTRERELLKEIKVLKKTTKRASWNYLLQELTKPNGSTPLSNK